MENQLKPKRLDYLDSLRGIAALMVCFGHYINWRYGHYQTIKIASFFLNPNDAVSFFFVLSGMVLSYPYIQLDRRLDIGKFFVARVFRIFPAYLLALTVVAFYVSRNAGGVSDVFKTVMLNKTGFWKEAALIFGVNELYLPGWTLTIELCMSFFMPFLIIIAQKNRNLLPWLFLAAFLSAKITGLFLCHFILGIMITAYFTEISGPDFKVTWFFRNRKMLLCSAIIGFSFRHLVYISPLGNMLGESMYFVKLFFYLLSGLAAFVFILFLIHSERAQRIFQHPVLIFYGRISYSVYLMHFVFVCAIWDYWESSILPYFQNEKLAFIVMMFVCFACTTITATLLHYFIELPFIKIGKKVAGKAKSTVVI